MVERYRVQWKNSGTDLVTFFKAVGGPSTGNFGVRQATTFEFKADWQGSDSQFNGFTIEISPDAPDLTVDIRSGPLVRVTTAYTKINAEMPLNMKVKTNQHSFDLAGGKPIIRNEPHHTLLNPTYMVAAIIALLVIAVIVYFAFFSQ